MCGGSKTTCANVASENGSARKSAISAGTASTDAATLGQLPGVFGTVTQGVVTLNATLNTETNKYLGPDGVFRVPSIGGSETDPLSLHLTGGTLSGPLNLGAQFVTNGAVYAELKLRVYVGECGYQALLDEDGWLKWTALHGSVDGWMIDVGDLIILHDATIHGVTVGRQTAMGDITMGYLCGTNTSDILMISPDRSGYTNNATSHLLLYGPHATMAIGSGGTAYFSYAQTNVGTLSSSGWWFNAPMNLNTRMITNVEDVAYSSSTWDGSTRVPSMNAVRDRLHTMSTYPAGGTLLGALAQNDVVWLPPFPATVTIANFKAQLKAGTAIGAAVIKYYTNTWASFTVINPALSCSTAALADNTWTRSTITNGWQLGFCITNSPAGTSVWWSVEVTQP